MQWVLQLVSKALILVQSYQGMYERMKVHGLIVEFVFGTHCILTQQQVKPKLPNSPLLLHRNATFSIGIYLRQIDDSKASVRTVNTHEVR